MTDAAIVALAAAFVAAVAAGIAFGQWRTARWKLAADLHPVRFAAYKAILSSFEGWYRQGPMTPERHEALVMSLAAARYLFGPEVRDRIDLTIAQVHMLVDREGRPDIAENELVRDHIGELYDHIYRFYEDEDLFMPYLRLEPKNPRVFSMHKRSPPRRE